MTGALTLDRLPTTPAPDFRIIAIYAGYPQVSRWFSAQNVHHPNPSNHLSMVKILSIDLLTLCFLSRCNQKAIPERELLKNAAIYRLHYGLITDLEDWKF